VEGRSWRGVSSVSGVPFEVVDLWRYPVKSMQGERLDTADITAEGIAGDRGYGIVDDASGTVLTGRREPRLLLAAAAYGGDGEVTVTLPDGAVARTDDDLSSWLGRAVHLQAAQGDVAGRYEIALDFEHEDTAEWFSWEGPAGAFHDSTQTRVSLVSVGTIGSWDRRRFRANVILSGSGEEALVGSSVRAGALELEIRKEIDRCVMVTRPQPGGIARDLDILRTINRERNGNLGIGALVRSPGRIAVGDALTSSSA
jgi:uncharacterized protein